MTMTRTLTVTGKAKSSIAHKRERGRGKFFVAIAGNIGVGKTELTKRFAERLGGTPLFESVEDNPHLDDFYRGDMHEGALHSQVYFLSQRLKQYHILRHHAGPVIQDRTVYEDGEIFAQNLYRQGFMSKRDWHCYRELYDRIIQILPPPDLVVYLQASVPTLMDRIAQRDRDYEQTISPEYLSQLNDLYEKWAAEFSLCSILTLDTNHIDFVHHATHFDQVTQSILEELQAASLLPTGQSN